MFQEFVRGVLRKCIGCFKSVSSCIKGVTRVFKDVRRVFNECPKTLNIYPSSGPLAPLSLNYLLQQLCGQIHIFVKLSKNKNQYD